MSYPTRKITVATLWRMMRAMEIGTEIGLAQTESGDYSYGIRRLPGDMFDNGSMWVADYFGGGSAAVFTCSSDETRGEAPDRLTDWLKGADLLQGDGTVFMQLPGSCATSVWKFEEEWQEPRRHCLACVNFELSRPYHLYVSVPEGTPCDDVQDIAKRALARMTPGDFQQKVWDDSDSCDPYIDVEDIQWMEVDGEYNSTNGQETDLPVGTVTK